MPQKTPSLISFADLANITQVADCMAAGAPIVGCDPYGRAFQPYVVMPARALSFMGAGIQQTGILGTVLALITLSTVTLLSLLIAREWTRGLPGLVLTQVSLGVAAISPAVLLGVERGQIEQLVMALAVVALITLPRQSGASLIGLASSFIAIATKYLAVGLFLAFVDKSVLKRRHWVILTAATASLIFLLLNIPELRTAAEASRSGVPQTSVSAFGLTASIATTLSLHSLAESPPEGVAKQWAMLRIVGLAIFAVAVVASTYLLRAVTLPRPLTVSWTLTIGSGGVLLLPYVLGSSHDYRLIFLVPLIAGAGIWGGSSASGPRAHLPWLLIGLATAAAATSTSMVPTPQGWQWPPWSLVLGDICLFGLLTITLSLVLIAFWRSMGARAELPLLRFDTSTPLQSSINER